MTRVPAVCDTCGSFFPSPIEVSNSSNITFAGNKVGPCPRCGGMGHIPDGTYNFIGNTIEVLSGPKRSRSDLERLAEILRSARNRGATAEQVREQVKKEVPELSSLTDALPKTRAELYAFVAIILTVLTLLLAEIRKGNQPNIEVTQVINQITQIIQPPPSKAPTKMTSVKSDLVPHVASVGRNDLCPCGSGKKYKKCHLVQP
jgi:SEC-C motif